DITSSAGSAFSGVGGGFGMFPGSPNLIRPIALSDFDLTFDISLIGLEDLSSPISGNARIDFRYPDAVADGDNNGNDFGDYMFRVTMPFAAAAQNGVFETISVNAGDGTVNIVNVGGTPENQTLSFVDFVNGDPNYPTTRDYSLVQEYQVQIQLGPLDAFGFDSGNGFIVDNVFLDQSTVLVPEAGSAAVILLFSARLFATRRRH
ncbi:MAG: hypothetical protein AAF664_23150, partial [Planctomycetota bacterium]